MYCHRCGKPIDPRVGCVVCNTPAAPPPAYGPPPVHAPYAGYPPAPHQPPVVMHQSTFVNVGPVVPLNRNPGCIVTALYFLFVGWWLGSLMLLLALALCGGIITIPLGLPIFQRLGYYYTLNE